RAERGADTERCLADGIATRTRTRWSRQVSGSRRSVSRGAALRRVFWLEECARRRVLERACPALPPRRKLPRRGNSLSAGFGCSRRGLRSGPDRLGKDSQQPDNSLCDVGRIRLRGTGRFKAIEDRRKTLWRQ